MLVPDLIELLRCPLTSQRLALAEPDALAAINARAGMAAPLEAALIRADRAVLYPVVGGIPVLLPDRAIPV